MKSLPLIGLSAASLVGATGLLFMLFGLPGISPARSDVRGWEAVSNNVKLGNKVRLEVRPKGFQTPPDVKKIVVVSAQLDMGPDGMATMTAPVSVVSSDRPGILAFESDLMMAGRWQLTISARVTGLDAPVTGSVIFTAIDGKPKPKSTDASGKPRKIVYYRNPMGLPDVSPTPKKDSMGMDYIPVYEDEVSGPAGSLQLSIEKVQRAGVRTEKVRRRSIGKSVLATGTVTPDEAKLWITSAKYSGFVEKLHVAHTGAKVQAGEPLMTVWIENGDLLRKQADYLTAVKSTSENDKDGSILRTRRNLETFGFPQDAIEEITRTRSPTRQIVMRSKAAGTIIEKPAIEGMRFEEGHMHFKIADLSTVWVIAEVAERDLGVIRINQHAKMRFTAYPGELFEGRVTFIYPDVNMSTRTGRVRIELANADDRIKIGLYSDVEISSEPEGGPVVAVPESAIIDNGERRVVMVSKGDGRFEPRDVQTGRRSNNYVEILKGLKESETVVTTGNFLIDAESNLRAALTAFTAPQPVSSQKETSEKQPAQDDISNKVLD